MAKAYSRAPSQWLPRNTPRHLQILFDQAVWLVGTEAELDAIESARNGNGNRSSPSADDYERQAVEQQMTGGIPSGTQKWLDKDDEAFDAANWPVPPGWLGEGDDGA
jgi:hypothetical protein